MNRNNQDLTRQIQPGEIQKIYEELQRAEAENFDIENRLNELRLTNAKRLSDLILEYHDKEYKRAAENADKVYKATEVLLQKEFSTKAILDSQQLHEKRQELTNLYAQEKEALKNKSKEEKAELKKQFSQRRKDKAKELKDDLSNLKKTDKEAYKAYKARIKFETEERSKAARAALDNEVSEAKSQYGKLGNFVGLGKGVKKALDNGATPVEAAGAALDQAVSMISNYAKKLEGTMTSVAMSQSEIDTRLQGSRRTKNGLGSYWQGISDTITKNVGMSPFIKQEDVVSKLKDLVGSGISFNVEQRAFLDTISEKIATTFSATDASLVKLVRIQQADSTAARLGMESALTSFLNNMYETTEYMSEIASDIRSQIYEASALMGAEEAATFEYQVQKWMGSLHSVGFNNTSGLAGALGKLAAGDISGITGGGYGNLLVMAANRANLSVAELLASGLDDSSTNALMQAMVEYLGGIYDETKNNKVVAQQFANVYGLTASDLKAAANLAGSTQNIYKNNLNYGGMLGQLNSMADSIWRRTSTGEMLSNLSDNLNYTMAASMGSNPALYATYTIAQMLTDTVGGINIPSFMAMGTGFDLNATVADLMSVGAMSGGILSGIGKLIGGLSTGGGFSGPGMLKAFGVNTSGTTTVTRGTGAGLMTTNSGMTVSNSGFIGNVDGSDVYAKTLTDANDDANKQLAAAVEESVETSMTTVDEHIIQIYTLLQDVVTGSQNLHVTLSSNGGWSSSGYSPSGVPGL